jgi:hypothetical protein
MPCESRLDRAANLFIYPTVKVRHRCHGAYGAKDQSPLEEEPAEVDQSTNNNEKPSMV